MVHAQSAATFELPLTRPSLSQRTLKIPDVDQPPGVRLAICKQVVPAGRARDAAILSFIAEYPAEPGRTKLADDWLQTFKQDHDHVPCSIC